MKTKANWQIVLLPIFFFIAAVNFHYYSFYKNTFAEIFIRINQKPSISRDLYSEMQRYHPYNDLYIASLEYQQQPVYYLYSRYNPTDKIATDELQIRVHYFFYPRVIKPSHTIESFFKQKFISGGLVISDFDLAVTSFATQLKRLNTVDSLTRPQDYFFKQEKPYYLYKIL